MCHIRVGLAWQEIEGWHQRDRRRILSRWRLEADCSIIAYEKGELGVGRRVSDSIILPHWQRLPKYPIRAGFLRNGCVRGVRPRCDIERIWCTAILANKDRNQQPTAMGWSPKVPNSIAARSRSPRHTANATSTREYEHLFAVRLHVTRTSVGKTPGKMRRKFYQRRFGILCVVTTGSTIIIFYSVSKCGSKNKSLKFLKILKFECRKFSFMLGTKKSVRGISAVSTNDDITFQF